MEEINEDYTKYSEGLITDVELLVEMNALTRSELDLRVKRCKEQLEEVCEAAGLTCEIIIDGIDDLED
jgi:hypothetical protein